MLTYEGGWTPNQVSTILDWFISFYLETFKFGQLHDNPGEMKWVSGGFHCKQLTIELEMCNLKLEFANLELEFS